MNQRSQTHKKNLSILIVDDEEMVLKMIERLLAQMGYQTHTAQNKDSALQMASNIVIDIAILDYNLPDGNGIDLMIKLKKQKANLQAMIMTGFGTIERAVEALKAGAWDFIPKPVTPKMLIQKLERLEEVCMLYREHDFQQKALNGEFEFSGVVGTSEVMRPTFEAILRAAASNLPCLIEGETGSGKEYIAESIHLNNKRSNHPFVVLDCTATPTSLFEATLFGSTKGAFTGAVERKGLLEAADGGTLFLDEVGEISIEIQPKLLRCLETKRFRPVGSAKEIQSDFRIICATNRNLLSETKEGNFRTDLFYRISAQRITLPPLRERKSDIPILAEHFLHQTAIDHEQPDIQFSQEALQLLTQYQWPGNIRQLKFVVESAFFNAAGNEILPDHLLLHDHPATEKEETFSPDVDTDCDFKTFRERAILDAERAYMKSIMEKTQGDVRKAAEQAGLTREALYRVMSRCDLSPATFRKQDN